MTTLHHQLADAQGALRDAEDFYRLCKATAEERANVDGKNEAERARKLILAIAGDADYGRALFRLRSAEQAVDRLKADVAAAEDDRRAWEWSIRAGLVEALGTRHEPFDVAMDGAVDRGVFENGAGSFVEDAELPGPHVAPHTNGHVATADWF